MTASIDNNEASVPGVIRDPINAYLLRVNSDGSINANVTGVTGSSITSPGGRLTLTTGVPVMIADATAQGTVYYDSYVGNSVPIYNGTNTAPIVIAADEISLALNATDNPSGNSYDIFAFSSSGTLTLGTGPAWTNSTTRSAAIALKNGIWTNNASIVLRAGGASLGTIAANQATYLGTIRTTGNGQTGMAFKPAAASGGSNNVLGVWNAYNRVAVHAQMRDSTSSWTYGTATWRAANGNTANRISWVDGLAQSFGQANYNQACLAGATSQVFIGCMQNWTSGGPDYLGLSANATNYAPITAPCSVVPTLGLNYVQAIESVASAVTSTYNGNTTQILMLDLQM